MNSTVKKLLMYLPVTALGLWCAGLQNRILTTGFDEKGLLIPGNPDMLLLWGVTGVLALSVLCLLPRLGGNGCYEDNFPSCLLSGSVMVVSGLLMGFRGLNALVPGMLPGAVLSMAAGALMGLAGVMRMLGKNPTPWPDLGVGLYYAWWMLTSYGGWNADPHVQRYAFHLLAGAAVMLFTLHRARMAGGRMERRRLVFLGFLGIFLSLAAIPGAESPMLYLASGLWCAGGMCDLRRLEKET